MDQITTPDNLELYDSVTLADGQTFNCDYLATIPIGFCFISVYGRPLAEIVAAFSDRAATARITYGNHEVEGYTVFVSVSQETEKNRYKVSLRRPYVGEEA